MWTRIGDVRRAHVVLNAYLRRFIGVYFKKEDKCLGLFILLCTLYFPGIRFGKQKPSVRTATYFFRRYTPALPPKFYSSLYHTYFSQQWFKSCQKIVQTYLYFVSYEDCCAATKNVFIKRINNIIIFEAMIMMLKLFEYVSCSMFIKKITTRVSKQL